MTLTIEWFNKKCASLKIHKKIYIGYSGGIDSGVLLNLCINSFYKKEDIRVIHINHSFSKNSNAWNVFCITLCNKLRISLHTITLTASWNTNASEDAFRAFRFQSFSENNYKNSTLFLAHNKNDVVETIFLKLFRGSGTLGMTSIKEKIKIKNLNIVRPLLLVDKSKIIEYADKARLPYVVDFSNFNNNFSRNLIRNKILFLITKKWIGVNKSLCTFSTLSSMSYACIYNRCKFFLQSKGFNLKFISIQYLTLIPKYLRYEILRLWVKENNYKTPSFLHLNEIDKILMSDKKNTPYIKINTYKIKKLKNNLYIENFKKKSTQYYVFFYKSKTVSVLNLNIICRKKHFIFKKQASFFLKKIIKYKNITIIIPGFWISTSYVCLAEKFSLLRLI